MKRPFLILAASLLCAAATQHFDPGQIPDPVVLLPDGPATAAVILLSSGSGWTDADAATARRLRDAGAAVVGVDAPAYLAALDAEGKDCLYLVADIERLGHQLERATGATAYHAPLVAGTGMGGALALDILTQTPADTLGGVFAADPDPTVPLRTALCTGATRSGGPDASAYALATGMPPAPLTVLLDADASDATHARIDAMTRAGVAFDALQASDPAPAALASALAASISATAVADSSAIVELPTTPAHDAMAIMLSGDGGWRDLDKSVAGALQAEGVPTVGLDSLRWFWSERTPDETAREIAQLIDVYTERWGVRRAILAGYSFGANVLPETYLALPEDAKTKVAEISLLGPSNQSDWQITVSGWLGSSSSKARPTGPALAQLPQDLLQCIHGRDEKDSPCPALERSGAEVIETKGGHHFDGDYRALAAHILDGLDHRVATGN